MRRRALLTPLALLALACSGPSAGPPITVTGPSRVAFPPVGDVFEARCGSLDCHGAIARNMRVYGFNGLRLTSPLYGSPDAGCAPDSVTGQGVTMPCEYDATYTSIESIQPEIFALVLREGGARPERWIVVAKGNGTIAHKGKTAMPVGGSADRCVRSWLTGNIDAQACLDASEYLPPGPL